MKNLFYGRFTRYDLWAPNFGLIFIGAWILCMFHLFHATICRPYLSSQQTQQYPGANRTCILTPDSMNHDWQSGNESGRFRFLGNRAGSNREKKYWYDSCSDTVEPTNRSTSTVLDRVKNTLIYLNLAWPPATYNVTSRNHRNRFSLVSKSASGIYIQLLKWAGADEKSSWKKSRILTRCCSSLLRFIYMYIYIFLPRLARVVLQLR